MAQLLVREIEESVKLALKRRAARHGRSMEEEVRVILRNAVEAPDQAAPGMLGSRISARFAGVGLREPLPEWRGEVPTAVDFDDK